MKIGNSRVDFKGLLIDGPAGRQSMEPKIMDLLRVLVENAGEVMTREDLITAVWGVEYGGDERLSRAISILRKALGDQRGQHTHIATISRVGYRLIAEVGPADCDFVVTKSSFEQTTDSQATSPSRAFPVKAVKGITAFLIAAAIIGVFIFSGGRIGETVSLQAKMERGLSLVENYTPKGAIVEAKDIFSEILSKDPDHAGARAGLAFALLREYTHVESDPALFRRAKAHAEAALRKDEHLVLANIAVAWAAEFEGDIERANKYLDRAEIMDAGHKLAYEVRFRTFGKQGQYEQAENVINEAIEAYPDDALLYVYRGQYWIHVGELAAAEDDFKKSIELSPDNATTYGALAHSLYLQNRTDEAVSFIQQGLSINQTALLYNNLGTYLFFQGQYDLASSAFEKTLELSGDTHNYLYWANLGDAHRWSKDKTDQAATAYRRAIQLLQVDLERSPESTNHKTRAALFNAKLGNLDEAQKYLNQVELSSASQSVEFYRAIVTNEILSNRSEALKYLKLAFEADYPLIEILNDPELSLLRQDPEYHRLLAETKND